MPPLSETAQSAYNAWKESKARVKIARDTVKDAQGNDAALQDADDARKLAAEAYRAERFNWDGKHEHLLTSLADAKAEEKEAHLLFTDCVTTAMGQQLPLLILDDGRKVEVTVSTKAKVVDEKPASDTVTTEAA